MYIGPTNWKEGLWVLTFLSSGLWVWNFREGSHIFHNVPTSSLKTFWNLNIVLRLVSQFSWRSSRHVMDDVVSCTEATFMTHGS